MNPDLEVSKVFSKLKKDSQIKLCYKNDSNCTEDIINAHTIQNNRILNKISKNGRVLMYEMVTQSLRPMVTLGEYGRNQATTFKGFCKYHDREIFKPIELIDYQAGNKEQNFLFFYRAISHNYYISLQSKKMFEGYYQWGKEYLDTGFIRDIKEYNQILNPPKIILEMPSVKNRIDDLEKVIDYMETERIAINSNLDKSRFDRIQTDMIVFNKEHHIAVCQICDIKYDLYGNKVNHITGNQKVHTSPVLTIFPHGGKTYVLFSYFAKYKDKFELFKKQVLNKSPKEQAIILSNIIAQYTNYFTISPDLWQNLPNKQKNAFNRVRTATEQSKGLGNFSPKLVMDGNLNIFS